MLERKHAPSGGAAKVWQVRLAVFGALGAVAAAVVAGLYPTGYFGPLSARISGLFVKVSVLLCTVTFTRILLTV
jgi:hypothetical protein